MATKQFRVTECEMQALKAAIDHLEDMIGGGSEDNRHQKQLLSLRNLLKKLNTKQSAHIKQT